MAVPERAENVNAALTVLLGSAISYSTGVQQPVRATAVMSSHPRMRHAAQFNCEQGRAGSLHPEGQCSVDQTWTERQVCS